MEDSIKLATFRTYDSPVNAHIVKSKLESEGIPAFLQDEHINTLNPLFNVTVGGIKLKIRESDFDEAERILAEIESPELVDDDNNTLLCPQCGSKEFYYGFKSMKGGSGIISAILSFALMIFPIYFKTVYKCKKCGFEFKNKEKLAKKSE